jgi:hypothetical protein
MEQIYSLFVDGSLLDDLSDEKLVTPLSIYTFLVSLVGVVLFYYIINSVRFCKKRHWAIMLGISGLVVFVINIATCFSMEGKQIPRDASNPAAGYLFNQGDSVFFIFSLQMFLFACFYFFILSIIVKWWSTNCRKTPF